MPANNTRALFALAVALFCTVTAHAGGPRWYTGLPYYTVTEGKPVVFFTMDPLYYTDPGALAANVTHAQADTMVKAAAATWNVPTSRLTLAQGGTLAQHVSSDNTFFDGTKIVFPDDMKLANYHAKPIAIVYDTDGSVIDTLLGSGASDPSGCRQNAVVESVDGLDPAGTIDHAVLILNGRCVGANPDQLMQMQYQLMRAFGRIIGLAWSQLNDNVFTGVPTPIASEVQNWPVMHPIDVICGPYTYKCMANAFTLRPDDLSALALLYPVNQANITAGKIDSGNGATIVTGNVNFPTGQGMDTVNIVLRSSAPFGKNDRALLVSAVAGADHQNVRGNPVTGPAVGVAESSGTRAYDHEGRYFMQRVPITGYTGWNELFITTEPINPLYSGEYAIAGYVGEPHAMSGPAVTIHDGLEYAGGYAILDINMAGASNSCNPGSDGRENAPVAIDPSGLWNGILCSNDHTSWLTHTPKPGHSWTLEMTAFDEQGIGSAFKAHVLLGLWKAEDPTGTPPTQALTTSALNGMAVGLTQLRIPATSSSQAYRIAVTDARGQGRPDFGFRGRLLYADDILPAQVGVSGGRIIISGEGFRSGNIVKVNGVNANVISWSATQIVAAAPTRASAHMAAGALADVAVIDASTGGSTTMQAALSYDGAGVNSIVLVGAPAQVQTGAQSGTAFAVRVLSTDGVTPAPGATVQIVATGAGTTFAACGSPSCTLTTDANGLVQSFFTATAAGTVTLTATEQSGGAFVQTTINSVAPVRSIASLTPPHYLAAGAASSWMVAVNAVQDGAPAANQPIAWTAAPGLTLSAASGPTNSAGSASLVVSTTGLAGGTQSAIQGCAWTSICATTSVFAVDPSQWTVLVSSGAGQSITASATLAPVVLSITDAAGHPLESATVTVYQTVDAWEGPCPAQGRCPAAPVLASSKKVLTTDANGLITVTPLEVAGIASVVNIAASTGTQGFLSLSLTKTP